MMVPIIPVIGEIRANGMSTTSPKMAIPKANGTEYMKNIIRSGGGVYAKN